MKRLFRLATLKQIFTCELEAQNGGARERKSASAAALDKNRLSGPPRLANFVREETITACETLRKRINYRCESQLLLFAIKESEDNFPFRGSAELRSILLLFTLTKSFSLDFISRLKPCTAIKSSTGPVSSSS